jgi:hypothetical protein
MNTTWLVSANHWTNKDLGITDVRFEVKEDPIGPYVGLYVDAPGLGCSRTYGTQDPESAIRHFLHEHAMTLVLATLLFRQGVPL